MISLGSFHLTVALLAIASGAAVLWTSPKGGRSHRRLGWIYVASMLLLNGTALSIYRLFGGFGPFHVAALVSLSTFVPGFVAAVVARRRRTRQEGVGRARAVELHYYLMTWSYVGLLAAAVSEIATRAPMIRPVGRPGATFGIAVGLSTFFVIAVGARLINGRAARLLGPFTARPPD